MNIFSNDNRPKGEPEDDDDDEGGPNFFDENVPDAPRAPKVKKPKYSRDDPRYWEQPKSPYEHLRPTPSMMRKIYLCAALVVAVVLVCLVNALLGSVRQDCEVYGYLESMTAEGTVFKSHEGIMVPCYPLVQSGDSMVRNDSAIQALGRFEFSSRDTTLVKQVVHLRKLGKPARIVVREYRIALPWRGKTRFILTGVDSVSPSLIQSPMNPLDKPYNIQH